MPASLARAAALCAALALAAPILAQDALAQDADVATIDGAPVTVADLNAILSELPAQYQQLPDETLYDGIREQMIDQRLLAAAALAGDLADHPAVKRSLEMQRQGLLADFMLRAEIAERVTDAAIEAAYETRFADAPPIEEVRASHILVASEEQAQALKAELDRGADFAALAAEHGTDGTRARGGDLGWFSRDMMVPAFADAAFAMEEGAMSAPVQSQFGWHLIHLTGKRDRPAPALEEVRGEIEQELGAEAARAVIAELRAAAEIVLPEGRPGLESLRDGAALQFP
ncbi:MAG: peptidylprolyl isomerase [Rubrimonas sp.]|uniref:peptidylprolyl isomerase n=1 Tax=Rubrimonas sp. TaxID=2036015 RepID=UPI002FDE5DA4